MITSNINWPEGLPHPQRSGHQMNVTSPLMRTTLSSGRARQRRRFRTVPTEGNWQWVLTSSQAVAFEAWFRDAINDGAEWFNIQRLTPEGMLTLVCRFTDVYQGPSLFGRDRWRYSASLETWERPIAILPPGWGNFPEFILGNGSCGGCGTSACIIDKAMNREWPA